MDDKNSDEVNIADLVDRMEKLMEMIDPSALDWSVKPEAQAAFMRMIEDGWLPGDVIKDTNG